MWRCIVLRSPYLLICKDQCNWFALNTFIYRPVLQCFLAFFSDGHISFPAEACSGYEVYQSFISMIADELRLFMGVSVRGYLPGLSAVHCLALMF